MVEGVCDFPRYFEVVEATTPELRHEVFRLRYQVYAQELGWEPTAAGNFSEESDRFDRRAIFVLLRHRESARFIGCLRLVLADPLDPLEAFPFEPLAPAAAEAMQQRHGVLWRKTAAEISRVAVIGEFRRRGREKLSPVSESNGDHPNLSVERRGFPHIAAGLYIGAAALALERDVERVFALMEPRLARRLRAYGILFEQIGPPVEHHGQRIPYRLEGEDFEQGLSDDLIGLLYVIKRNLTESPP